MQTDTVELAQTLVRFDTTNPPGRELECLEYLRDRLVQAGFSVRFDEFAPGRASLSAVLDPGNPLPALCFGGHVDTVGVGSAPWKHDPFAGVIADGALHGRGSCDMKTGVAATVTAAEILAPQLRAAGRNLLVQFYGGEETGCEGSFHVQANPALRQECQGLIIGEPTGNHILSGHKGALWLEVTLRGRTSHASMPQNGENALIKALKACEQLGQIPLDAYRQPYLGAPTLAVTRMHAGHNINAIPDEAVFTLDIRTVPGFDTAGALNRVRDIVGEAAQIRTLLDLPPVWTDPLTPWVERAKDLQKQRTGIRNPVETVQFFTDAAAMKQYFPEVPVIILGPGDPNLAHQTDEHCPLEQIRAAHDLYVDLASDWYGLQRPEPGSQDSHIRPSQPAGESA